jgi:hypothetical protein
MESSSTASNFRASSWHCGVKNDVCNVETAYDMAFQHLEMKIEPNSQTRLATLTSSSMQQFTQKAARRKKRSAATHINHSNNPSLLQAHMPKQGKIL